MRPCARLRNRSGCKMDHAILKTTALYRPALFAALADYYMPLHAGSHHTAGSLLMPVRITRKDYKDYKDTVTFATGRGLDSC